jgi:monovalent cation:H+ antiporter-2, CPA2 family
MQDLTLVFDLVVVLGCALIGGLIAKKLKQPLILGYILAGITLGAVVVGQFKGDNQLQTLADIGVAFLLFSIGIEFSFSKLSRVKEIAFWGAVIQILAFIFLSVLIFPAFGFDFYSSLFLGCCFSLSSTAVVTKILMEKGESDSLHGEIMIGWLLVQDLAVLPMLLILPNIANLENLPFWQLPLTILQVFVLLIVVLLLGRLIVPKLLDKIAGVNSREVLLLAVTALCLLAASGTYFLGLSFALGAFLAGLIISESTENHAVFSEIRPLKDLFSIVFFVTLGMMLTPSFLFANLLLIIGLSIIVIFLKFVIVMILSLYFGYHTKTSFLVSTGIVQVGEFSFVLGAMGLSKGFIGMDIYQIIISVALLTILITPFLANISPKLYTFLKKYMQAKSPGLYSKIFLPFDQGLKAEELPFENHVVICGYGRVGSWLGRACQISDVPFVVVDFNRNIIDDLSKNNIPVVYGDPSDADVLDFAQVDKAKVVVIAIPDRHTQEMVIANSLTLNPKINIICRSHFEEDQGRLKALGVTSVIMPEFEASLSITHKILQSFGYDKDEVNNKIKRIKIEHGME